PDHPHWSEEIWEVQNFAVWVDDTPLSQSLAGSRLLFGTYVLHRPFYILHMVFQMFMLTIFLSGQTLGIPSCLVSLQCRHFKISQLWLLVFPLHYFLHYLN